MKKMICAVLTMAMLTCGCGIAALTAASAYAVSSIGSKNTEQKKAYNDYLATMHKINSDRIKAGLAPEPVKSFEEWNQ